MALADPAELAQVRRIAIDDALFRPGGPCDGGAYSSMMAVSLTTECLRQVRARMPQIDEIIFVPRAADVDAHSAVDPARARATLALQVYTALRDLQCGVSPVHNITSCKGNDHFDVWCPPKCTILAHPISGGALFATENDHRLPEWPSVW
jgi:hypothetical protein